MNGIIAMTDLALDTPRSPEQDDYLRTVRSCADAMMTVIDDILDFAKIETGKLEMEFVEFDLLDCVEDVVKLVAPAARDKGLGLMFDHDLAVPRRIVGDTGRLRQVLLNLVGNAIKFTHDGEVLIQLDAKTRAAVHFQITDTGIGIRREHQKHIFEPFTQADTSSTGEYGGTGLGLAICSQWVRMMGGQLWVESTEGRGSTFHFTMSLEPAS